MLATHPFKNESHELKNSFVSTLKKYLETQGYPEKITHTILDKKFLSENPPYYTYYPHLFNEAFGINDSGILETLSLAGFLYYKAIINIDAIFDQNPSESSFHKYIVANICQEETIKLLSGLFSPNHPFWNIWNKRKLEYVKAYNMDKNPEVITSYKEYELLADYKCAFGKIAIDSLYFLSENRDEDLYKNVLLSHKHFYTAFQIVDDITDFEEDAENKQFNLLAYELKKQLSQEEISHATIKSLKTKLFLNGTIEKAYEMALSYIKLAASTDVHSLEQWNQEIQFLNNIITTHKLNVNGFIEVFRAKQTLSHTKNSAGNNLNQAVQSGLEFITKSQKEDGSWNDYFNEAGISNSWATAFVLNYLPHDSSNISEGFFNAGISFLEKVIGSDGLWGYNDAWITDADSTSFAMLSLLKSKKSIDEKTLSTWLQFQKEDGGFSTYNDARKVISSLNNESITNVEGWTSSQFCVSATAYCVLCKIRPGEESFFQLRDYLLENLKKEHKHYSYWWTDFSYTLTFIIKGAEISADRELLSLSMELLKKHLDTSSIIKSNQNFFYLGMILDCICSSENSYNLFEEEANQIALLLTDSQMTDGSWMSDFSLRIPAPNERNPSSNNINWIKSDKGTNILVNDYQRLFTTVVSVAGLEKYGKIGK